MKRSQQCAHTAARVDHTSCISESIMGRSREERTVYPEVLCKTGGKGDKLQTEKLRFKDQINPLQCFRMLYDKHLTGAEEVGHLSWVKICLGDDQNTTG